MRSYIHIQLCITIIISQLVFVTAIDKTGSEVYLMIVCLCRSTLTYTEQSLYIDCSLGTLYVTVFYPLRLDVQQLLLFFIICFWLPLCGC